MLGDRWSRLRRGNVNLLIRSSTAICRIHPLSFPHQWANTASRQSFERRTLKAIKNVLNKDATTTQSQHCQWKLTLNSNILDQRLQRFNGTLHGQSNSTTKVSLSDIGFLFNHDKEQKDDISNQYDKHVGSQSSNGWCLLSTNRLFRFAWQERSMVLNKVGYIALTGISTWYVTQCQC